MYPNLYYLFKDIFGLNLPFLQVVNTFGFCVALSFLAAAWFLIQELKRKQSEGFLTYTVTTVTVGQPATTIELLVNFVLGFLLGFKILGLFFIDGALNDPQAFIFSGQGSVAAGLLLGLFFTALKWWEKNKNKLAKPEKRSLRIWPSDRVGDVVIIAAVTGFIGAKIFDNLENWDRFIQDPIGNLFSPSGLTFYGGLIVATIFIILYLRKHKVQIVMVADAIAPSLMLAYGLGRIGCQVAGDGDWGILNSAYISTSMGEPVLTTPRQFNTTLHFYQNFYNEQFESLQKVHHAATKAFWGLPDWLFAFTYKHNVNKEGIPLPNCTWNDYCTFLPIPVYPTPLYEIIMCLLLFAFLWSIRKKVKVPGRLAAIYLIVNGVERYFIEKIRVNTTYNIFGYHPTQAELISSFLIIAGIVLYWYAPKINYQTYKNTSD